MKSRIESLFISLVDSFGAIFGQTCELCDCESRPNLDGGRERERERELYLSPSLIEWKIVAAVSPSLPPLCKVCSCLEASMYDVDKLLRFSHSIPIPLFVLFICKFGQFLGNQPLRRRHTCRHPFC